MISPEIFLFFRVRITVISPSGTGILPFISVNSPNAGATVTVLKPGDAGIIPQMVARKS